MERQFTARSPVCRARIIGASWWVLDALSIYAFPKSLLMHAGLLQLAHCAVVILFYRCFMRFSFLCPPHVTIDMNVARWDKVLTATREAIEWTASHSDILDGPFIVPYALSLCAVIQVRD